MNRYLILLITTLLLISCTTSRWIVSDEPALDPDEFAFVGTDLILKLESLPTPEKPVVTILAYSKNSYEFAKKLEARRYVQKYKPRYGWMAVGLLGSAAILYVANTDSFLENAPTGTQKTALNITSGVLAMGSVFNLKRAGEPRFTGEKRFLNRVGSEIRIDTTLSPANIDVNVLLDFYYNDEPLATGVERKLTGNQLNINLISELTFRSFSSASPGDLTLKVTTTNESYEYKIPVESFLKRYARVVRRNTPVRSSPVISANNVITTTAEASLLPWVNTSDSGWHQVMLGVTPAYIRSDEAAIIWRPISGGTDMVITTREQRFGDIDVERNIPLNKSVNQNSIAIIISNQNYVNPMYRNRYSERSAQLMRSYLTRTLGYPEENILVFDDIDSENINELLFEGSANTILGRPINAASTNLFVYYAGKGATYKADAHLLPVDEIAEKALPLRSFLLNLGKFNTKSTTLILDTDFITSLDGSSLNQNAYSIYASTLNSRRINSWILFSSEMRQLAGVYTSSDFRTDNIYPIVTYYFCRALQDGNTNTGDIFRYIQRNVTFTSRRLHNRPQDPQLFGNSNINLADIE